MQHRVLRCVEAIVVVFGIILSLTIAAGLPTIEIASAAVNAKNFNAGYIISDSHFYDSNAMTAAQVQTFLNQQVPTCHPEKDSAPSTIVCLKNYSTTTTAESKDAYCAGYVGGKKQTAAQIIDGVARSCGVSQKVLIVLLQKENGLVTHTWPSPWRYETAMGFGCPDTAECDAKYYGFFNQVYNAARQYKLYKLFPAKYQYRVGTNKIYWNPAASCGTSTVTIKNQATAGLYNYTPYRPNQAALNAGYGEGDGCSSYGNRNFYLYYGDWFGDPTTEAGPILTSMAAVTIPNGQYYINSALAYTSSIDIPGASKLDKVQAQLYVGNQSVAQRYQFTRQSDGSYEIVNMNSGKALDVYGASTSAGSMIDQYARNNSKAQRWFIRQAEGGSYYLQSALGNFALSVNGSTAASKTQIVLNPAQNAANQKFLLSSTTTVATNTPVEILSALNNNYTIDVAGASSNNGAAIQLHTVNGTSAQEFVLKQVANGVYEIANGSTSKLIEIPGGATANGSVLQQYQSNGTQAQRWFLRDAGNGRVSFYNLNSGKFVELSGGIVSENKRLTIYTGNGTIAQQWMLKAFPQQTATTSPTTPTMLIANGTYRMGNDILTSTVLEIAGARTENGIRTSLYQSNGTKAQQWTITNLTNGSVRITNVNSGKVLDVAGAQTANHATVQQYSSNGTKAQEWFPVKNADGSITFKSALNGQYVLDAHNGQTVNGTIVALYSSNGSKAQRWILSKLS